MTLFLTCHYGRAGSNKLANTPRLFYTLHSSHTHTHTHTHTQTHSYRPPVAISLPPPPPPPSLSSRQINHPSRPPRRAGLMDGRQRPETPSPADERGARRRARPVEGPPGLWGLSDPRWETAWMACPGQPDTLYVPTRRRAGHLGFAVLQCSF